MALSPLPSPPPRPPAILYSAYQQFDMFLLSSRCNLKFHTFSSRYNLFTPVSAYYCNGLYYSFHSLHIFICIFCNGLYYSLHTRQGLTLIPFRHKVRGDPVKLSRYSINMTIFDNYSLAENADRARPDVFGVGVIYNRGEYDTYKIFRFSCIFFGGGSGSVSGWEVEWGSK